MTVSQLYMEIKHKFYSANINSSSFDSRVLIEHFLSLQKNEIANPDKTTPTNVQTPIHAYMNTQISEKTLEILNSAVDKRINGYPLQYLVGCWEFYGYPFYVGDGVLIPRADTETLIDNVKKYVANSKPISNGNFTLLDLCSGSGCIGITLAKEFPFAKIIAIEKSKKALAYLQQNILLNNVNITVIEEDACNKLLADTLKDIDIIVSNPPYLSENDLLNLQKEVSFEPIMALDGGYDGLFFYRELTAVWKNSLAKGGTMIYEIGCGQENDVSDIMLQNGFLCISEYKDLSSIIRNVSGIKN